jgi:cilia- and flagella-associated protein 44
MAGELNDDFFYEKGSVPPPALVQYELPRNSYALEGSLGFDLKRRNNLVLMDKETVLYSTGNTVHVWNINSGVTRHIFGLNTDGIGALARHPAGQYFAVGEKGPNPNIMIYEFPSLRLHRVCKKGTEMGYSCLSFSSTGEKLASVGMAPDFMLTAWDWKAEKIILRTKAFAQEVYNVEYSARSDGRLTTSGMGHIRFWKMAKTFTGLKLQGDIGKFGRVDLSDVSAFAELPDGKVLSGSESGMLLLWEGNFVKSEVSKPKGVLAHIGDITFIKYLPDSGRFVTAGLDGYVRQWPFQPIDDAEPTDEDPITEVEPLSEVCIGEGVQICGMIMGDDGWIVEDKSGKVWKYDIAAEKATVLKEFHAGAVNAVATSPADHFAGTGGEDGTVRCWDYVERKCLYSKKFNSAVSALSWAPASLEENCRVVCAGFADGVLRALIRGKDGWKTSSVCKPHNQRLTGIKFSPDGQTIATIGEDKTVFFLSAKTDGPKVMFEPLGFQSLESGPLSLDWNSDSSRLLVVTMDGKISELKRPANDSDTHHSFDMQLIAREFVYTPKPSFDNVTAESGDPDAENKEEKDDAENPFAVAKEVSKAISAMYKSGSDERFYVCLDGEEKDHIVECAFGEEYASDEMNSHNGMVTALGKSNSGKLVFTGGTDGCVRVRVLDDEMLTRFFINVNMHDANHGNVLGVTTSFDDKYIISAGQDGGVFTFRFQPEMLKSAAKDAADGQAAKMAEAALLKSIVEMEIEAEAGAGQKPSEVFGEVESSTTGDVHDAEAEEKAAEGVSDIVDPKAYSIQDAKLKTEHDNLVKQSERKKEKVRDRIKKLRKKFEAFRDLNNEEDPARQLSADDLVLDEQLKASLIAVGDNLCNEVRKEIEYDSTMKSMLLDKLQSKYYSTIAVEGIMLKAFKEKYLVDSFRVDQLSDSLQESLRAVHALLDAEEDAKRRAAKGGAAGGKSSTSFSQKIGKVAGEVQNVSSPADGGATVSRHEQQEQRKAMRAQRKQKIETMLGKKPSQNAEDPKDLADIESAKNNMGDYKLKTDKNYVVPEDQRVNAEKKRREMVLLEESIHAIKMGYNQRFLALRELKRRIIQNIKDDNYRMREIDSELGNEGKKYWEPELLKSEWPEGRMEVTEEELNKYAKDKGTVIAENSNEATGTNTEQAKSKEGGTSAPSVDSKDVDVVPSIAAAFSSQSCNAATDGDGSALEQVVSKEVRMELENEHSTLVEKINQTVSAFDEAVYDLRREKIKLDSDLKTAELRMLTFFEELSLLKEFQKKDTSLAARMEKTKKEKTDIMTEIQRCRESMNTKKSEIDAWQEKEKIIEGEFKSLVPESNQFHPILLKIYKRKIKRAKKKDDGDSDGEGSDYSSEESSSDEDDDDDDDDEDEDDSCPPGCDQALYDRVLEMREKRLDQEDVLQDFQKNLEDIKKQHDRVVIKQKQIDKDLQSIEKDIVKFQTEKQRELNQIYVTVNLQISQILCLFNLQENDEEEGEQQPLNVEDGLQLPASLSNSLVFDHQALEKLKGRREEMLEEVELLKQKFKSLHGTKRKLQKDKKLRQKEIEVQEARCVELQMLKFGQIIDLESLDKIGDSKMVDDLNKKISVLETKYEREVHKFRRGLSAVQSKMLRTIQDNTAHLERIAQLTNQQQTLEKELNNKGSAPGAAGGIMRQELEERQRLVQLVKLQAKEVDALKAEINMLRRKGGHVYTPAVAETIGGGMGEEMGGAGPEEELM